MHNRNRMRTPMARILMPVLMVAAVGAGIAHGKECKGVNFPDQVQVEGSTLMLNGLGLRQATAFKVNVYVAALYVAKTSSDPNALLGSNTPSELILQFVRNVGADDLKKGWSEGFEKKCQGSIAGAEGAHRHAQRMDGRCQNRRAANLHPQAGCRSADGRERHRERDNQRRRFCKGVSGDLARWRSAEPRNQGGDARRRLRLGRIE